MTGRAKGLGLGFALLAVLAAGVAALSGGPQSVDGRGERAGQPVAVPRLDLRVERYELGNGLEVILRKESRLPVVDLNLWYHVGPANEEPGRTGFAHLFEHMMFEGSGHVEEGAGDRLLEALGSSDDGSTGFDYTRYVIPNLPSNHLELALWLQSDRMGFLLDRVDQTSLTSQQAVVRNERRQTTEEQPYGLADDELVRRLFPAGHPYHGNVIGSHADIQAARLDDVRDFFRRYYVPNNASLVIVGDIDVAATRALVEKYFGTIPRGPEIPRRVTPPPPVTGEQRISMTDTVQLAQLTMAWPTPPIFEPGDDEAEIVAELLDGSRASRLTELLVHDLRIAQSVSAELESLANGSVFRITATAKPGHTLADIEEAIDGELADLAEGGPGRAEIDAAKNALIADTVMELDDQSELADSLNFYNHYLGDPEGLNGYLGRMAAVTPDRLQRFVAEHLDPDRRVVVEVEPGQKPPVDDPPAPEPPPASGDAPAGEQTPVSAEPWRNAVPAPGPAPATAVPPLQRFTLDNGLPVWLVESHHLPVVSASLVSRLGSAADPPDRPGLADFSTSVLDSGTTSRDAVEIAQELAAAGATIGNDTGQDGTWLSASSLTDRAADTLAILADVARNPTFPVDEVDRIRDAALVSIAQSRDSASTLAAIVARREVYGPGHPYAHRSSGTEEGVRSATVEDLRRAHARAFTPATTALLFAGDLTAAEARSLAEQAFGSWTNPDNPPGDAVPADPGPPAGNPRRVLVVDKPGSGQTALEFAAPGLRRSESDFESTLLANRIFGGAFASRLNQNLREDKGYTYGAYSDVDVARGVGLLSITMDVETGSTADAVTETLRELDTLTDTGVTADEFGRAREWMTRSVATIFATRVATLGTLRSIYLDGLPVDYFQTRPARLERLTAADVTAAAKRRFGAGAFTVVAVGERSAIEEPLRSLRIGPVSLRNP